MLSSSSRQHSKKSCFFSGHQPRCRQVPRSGNGKCVHATQHLSDGSSACSQQLISFARMSILFGLEGGFTGSAHLMPPLIPFRPAQCIRILESKVHNETAMKQAQPLGQKMDQARTRFRRAVESGDMAMEAPHKAQDNFEQAQQEVIQAQTDLDRLMQEAPLPVMPVPQVNVSLVRTLEALIGIIENLWNPDARQPPEHLIRAIQESRQILQTSSVILSQEGTFGAFETCMCDHPSLGKFLKFCFTSFALLLGSAPGRHWPACFDQTCGNPGEGPLTTLESPDAPELRLTPTQKITTCDMVRRKTKEKRSGHQLCRACESPLQPRQNGLKCRKCQYGHATQHVEGLLRIYIVVVCQALLRMRSRSTSIDARHGAGDGRPDGGCAVRSTIPERTRGLPGCALGDAYHPPHHVASPLCRPRPWRLRRFSRRKLIWPHRVPARQSRSAMQKPRIPLQWSAGLKSSYWSRRRQRQPCEPSGTSGGA